MKQIEQNEIFQNLSTFLKSRGIELTEGSYSHGLRKSCSLLTKAINVGQESIEKAKVELDKTCNHLRQVVHEKTAPKPPPITAQPKTTAGESKTRTAAPPKAATSSQKKQRKPRRR
jgi:hypothetical protein